MNILIDIGHPAHYNFFKNAIHKLDDQGHTVILTALDRGQLPLILNRELPDYKVKLNGKHKGTKLSIIVEANILRFIEQLIFVVRKKIDVAVSCGSITTGAVFKVFLNKPNIQFDDDPERKLNVLLEKITSTILFFPPIYKEEKSVKILKALKEWAYLSPTYFSPDIKCLSEYSLNPNEYIFIREVSNGSLNYRNQDEDIISSVAMKLPQNIKVVLSLEDKNSKEKYPKSWLILQEPVSDIHSLMYFSKVVISSGDSMAREGALLGVPSIYCGIREMLANRLLIDKGTLLQRL